MSKPHRQVAYSGRNAPMQSTSHVRQNEGSNVPVILGQVATVNGLSVQMAAVKLSDAPVPERKYVADVCGVTYVPGTVQLLFGQRRIGGDGLRSLLVIQMSSSGAVRFLAAISQLAPQTLEEMAKVTGIVAEKSAPINTEPEQTVALAASFVLLASAVDETTMDFYQASAFAISAMPHSGKLALDPVVRIDLRTSLLLGLVEELRKLSPQLPKMDISESSR
jgi:hypothetical protein